MTSDSSAQRALPLPLGAAGRVTTRLPLALKDLNNTALHQLTCTIAYSQHPDGQVVVELTGQDGTSTSDTCGLSPDNTETTPTETKTRARPTLPGMPTPPGTPGTTA